MVSGKVVLALVVVVCVIAAGSYAWFNRPRSKEEIDKQAELAKAKQYRDTKSAERLVDLKNTALADLENGQYANCDANWLNLATAGMREPLGRNWTINRLLAIGTFDLKRDPAAYEEAVERAQTALNLETSLEPKSAVRHYLGAKLAQARGSTKLRIYEEHIAAGLAPGDPVLWMELYQAQLARTDGDHVESEGALKYLKDLVPDNLYAQVEWLAVQARRKDAMIDDTLNRVHGVMMPLLADQGGEATKKLDTLLEEIRAAVKSANWPFVEKNVSSVGQMARALPEFNADRRRLERGIPWYIVSDYSHAYYQKHHIERRLPSAQKPVQFREVELSGPAAKITDALEARFVDWDGDGRLEIAVLRVEALEIFARDANNQWRSVGSAPLPRGAHDHFLAVNLGNSAAPDFLVYGPAGLRVIENRLKADGKTRSLRSVDEISLADGTTNALWASAVDLDADGLMDLIVTCRRPDENGASLYVLRNQGHGTFRDVTARSGLLNRSVGAGSPVVVDWDNDLDVDLLTPGLGTSAGKTQIAFFKGRGLARFRPQRFPTKDADVQGATSLAVLDADSNGSWDLLASGPQGMLLLLTSTIEHGRVEPIGVEAVSDFAADHTLVFDYDNDGCPDLIAWNGEAVRSFHGSPEGHFEGVADMLPSSIAAGTISSADFGDFDQDGDSDLIVVKPGPDKNGGRLSLLLNEGGNANNWIDVRLDAHPASTPSSTENRVAPFGQGSTLCLKIRGVSQTQIVQNPITHFGIGTLDAADVLRILWNTGVPANVLSPAKNTTVTQSPPNKPSP